MSLKNKVILSISIGLIVSMLFSTAGFASKCEKVSENVLRLHIVAASDSEEDHPRRKCLHQRAPFRCVPAEQRTVRA